MARFVYFTSMSLDGFMSDPDGGLDWALVDDELHQHFNDEFRPVAAFASGPRTYDLMASYWPHAGDEPNPIARDFAAIWLAKPKFVFSQSHPTGPAQWGTVYLGKATPSSVSALRARFDGTVILGGAELAASLLDLGEIDEVWLYVHPIVLGEGCPAFPASSRHTLELTSAGTISTGVAMLRYKVAAGQDA